MRTDAVIAGAPLQSPRSLPPDLLQRSARNVRIASLVIGSVWLIGLVINDVFFPLWFEYPARGPLFWPWPGRAVSLTGIAVALAAVLLARRVGDKRAIDVGLAFEVVTAFLVGFVEHWSPSANDLRASWIAVIIIAYPAIAPATPRKALVASLLAATMSPVGMALAWLRGADMTLAPFQYVWVFLPNYIAAAIAVVPAAIIRRLGKQVQTERELGSYRLGDMIGAGGMGQVYHATHRLLARPAAIKLIHPDALEGRPADRQRTTLERFRREAEAVASLRSPHTVELYDFGVSDRGVFYYVMELLDGVDLETLVERFGPVPPERVVHLLSQACESLAEAHARSLVHRDIKPSNIHVCRMGLTVDFVKLLDFGLVKPQPRGDPKAGKLTAADGMLGTPAFMAPEMILGEPAPDHRIDIYALGCVGYWLLTGSLVFDGETPVKIMMQHLEASPVPPSQLSEIAVPPALDAIILACLAKAPGDRPSSATDLARRLAAFPTGETWSEERARAWWDRHLPARDVVSEAAAEYDRRIVADGTRSS